VKVVVDANIVFSGILNSNGKIGDLLINSQKQFEFIAPDFLRHEISKHYFRLSQISGMTREEIREAEFQICKEITFISEEQIPLSVWQNAAALTAGIGPKDTPYVAFSKHFKCILWSSDKALRKGLERKNVRTILSTDELLAVRERLRKKSRRA
jgi:predicted nucleic acid-binding protein